MMSKKAWKVLIRGSGRFEEYTKNSKAGMKWRSISCTDTFVSDSDFSWEYPDDAGPPRSGMQLLLG
jgi:hypothetical protein